MSADEEFREKLAQGNNFEVNVVQPFILKQFPDYWLESTHDHRVGHYAGPKLHRQGYRPLTMPDFRITHADNHNDVVLFEAKLKAQPFSLAGHMGQQFVAIEETKCMQYEEAAKVLGAQLFYIVGVESLNTLHVVKPCTFVTHNFNNEYAKGVVRAFEINNTNKVGKLL